MFKIPTSWYVTNTSCFGLSRGYRWNSSRTEGQRLLMLDSVGVGTIPAPRPFPHEKQNEATPMSFFSSSAPRSPRRFKFATLAIVVVAATALYGLLLNQPWPG
jgi:hypothetical protein